MGAENAVAAVSDPGFPVLQVIVSRAIEAMRSGEATAEEAILHAPCTAGTSQHRSQLGIGHRAARRRQEISLILPPSERTCRRLSQAVASRETLGNRK